MKRRMRFGTWCRKDPEDTTMIVYTFRMKDHNGEEHTKYFTSEDYVSYLLIHRLSNAWIESITRVKNEFEDAWNVVIYEE